MPPVTESVRPQSLPLTSGHRVISHTELRSQQSATPPGSLAVRQQTLNPPPPLIQMSSSRDKKYVVAKDLALEASRSREGFPHTEAHHDRYLHVSQENIAGRDVSRHTHAPVDNRGGEREKRASVVETVDLTRDREASTSTLVRPTARSPVVALGSSSARATLQAMARYALAETGNADVTEKIGQKKKEDTYLPPRPPDPKLSMYEQNEAIRKFTALGNVCVSAPREFPVGGEYSNQPYALMAMQAHHQPHVHPHSAGTSTPPPYGYPFHVGHPMANFHHHPEHRFLVPVGVHQLPVHEMLPHSVNGQDLPSHLKLSGAYAHQYPQGAGYYPTSMRAVVPTYQPMTVCGHRYPVPLSEERRTMHHPLDVPVRRHNDISEQDLANPFVVKQPRHMQTPGMPERVVSPGELPKFPLPSRSPMEPAKRPHTISPEMKPQIVAHAERAKTVSPPAGNYLSRIPSRPASVSEMRNRAAVIPELMGTEGVVQKFPDPQPVVLVASSKHSGEEKIDRSAEDDLIKGDTKERPKEEKKGSSPEAIPMSAFATLVDVAAAARKVVVPIEERILQEETIEVQEMYGSPPARLTGHTMTSPTGVVSPPSPCRTSPGVSSSTPRYGITTGLVPKPPPLMPITGMRLLQEGSSSSSSSSSTPISISVAGHGNVSVARSPSKLTSPPGTRSTRASVSPDGPPPLISRTVISPTLTGSAQGTSPKGPPPLIKGIVAPVLPAALRSPEHDVDSTRKTKSNQEDVTPLRRPDQKSSEEPFQKSMSNVDFDFQQKFGMHFHESVPTSSQMVDDDDEKNCSPSPHTAGQAQVRTIFETMTYVDSPHAEVRYPSRHHLKPYQPPSTGVYRSEECPPLATSSSPLFTDTTEREDTSMDELSKTWTMKEKETQEAENDKNVQPHPRPERSCITQDQRQDVDQREVYSFQQESQAGYSDKHLSLSQNEQSAEAAVSHASGSETEEGDDGDVDTEDEVHPVHLSFSSLHPRIRALTRNPQSNPQSPCYDASDSETLSAEESEVPPESSDEMFPSTTMKPCTQSDSSSEGGKGDEDEHNPSDSTADTCHTSPVRTNVPMPSTSRDYSGDEEELVPSTSRDYSGDEEELVPSTSRDYSGDEEELAELHSEDKEENCTLQDTVTSTGPLSVQLLDVSTEEPTVDSPTSSTFLEETEANLESPAADAENEREIRISVGQETREAMDVVADQEWNPPSQSSSPDEPVVDYSSEALPAQVFGDLEREDAMRVDSSEDSLVGGSETDKAASLVQVESSDQQTSQDITDSSAYFENRPDGIETSSSEENVDNYEENVGNYEENVDNYVENVDDYEENVGNYEENIGDYEENVDNYEENVDNYDQNVSEDVASMVVDDNATPTVQSATDVQDNVSPKASNTQPTSPLEKDKGVYVCQSTSETETETENIVSTVLDQGGEEDEEVNEADALEKTPAEHGFLSELDTCSSSSDNHHPEISSAVDCVSDDGEDMSYPTFIGEFVPLPGEVDSPAIRSGSSTHVPSEESSVGDETPAEREMKDRDHPESPKQDEPSDVLSPDEGVRHADDTLSEGEIPPSQESSQSEDELVSAGDKLVSNKAVSILAIEPSNIAQFTLHLEASHPMADLDQRLSQSKETEEDDQLSDGEIPESEDEPAIEPSKESNAFPISSTLPGSNTGINPAPNRVSSSQEVTVDTGCYINMIPISPAPPESPSQESQGDRTSPLPPWPPIESQYSSVVSLSLAARMTSKATRFPYSILSINVGSASSSARSSPVPQSFAANLAPGSSPSSSSLLPRPQEPTPLLSDNYEPLSDDDDDDNDDDDGLADTSNISDEQNI